MKGKFGKIGIICLALVLALGTLGAAFAFWSEPVTIASTASTGYLQLELTHIVPSNGNITCSQSRVGNDRTEVTLNFTDVYPGYEGRIDFKIINTGSIPACIYDVKPENGYPYWAEVSFNQLLNANNVYLPVGQWVPGAITVKIYESGIGVGGAIVECEENYTFTFTVTILSEQWNAS